MYDYGVQNGGIFKTNCWYPKVQNKKERMLTIIPLPPKAIIIKKIFLWQDKNSFFKYLYTSIQTENYQVQFYKFSHEEDQHIINFSSKVSPADCIGCVMGRSGKHKEYLKHGCYYFLYPALPLHSRGHKALCVCVFFKWFKLLIIDKQAKQESML